MLKHIVLMKFKPEAPEGAADDIMEALRALPAAIPEVVSLEVGANVVESLRNADLGLVVEFQNREALDRYSMHPDHQTLVQELIRPILDSSVVVDFES